MNTELIIEKLYMRAVFMNDYNLEQHFLLRYIFGELRIHLAFLWFSFIHKV